jgi:NAD(P)-dependent dehydrogenase (short-subunit alcohol dehydrogenase family)
VASGDHNIHLSIKPKNERQEQSLSTEIEITKRIIMSLQGKNVIITGATSGLGVQMAAALSSAGATVFIGGRRADTGARVAQDTNSTFHVIDVADEESNKAFFAAAAKHFGGQNVDYIILNAGVEGN